MKFFNVNVENLSITDTWIEENNIPFRSRTVRKFPEKAIYKDCFLYKGNIDLFDNPPENIRIVSDFDEDNLFKKDVYTIFSDGGIFNGNKKPDKPIIGSMATIILKNDEEMFLSNKALENITIGHCELNAGLTGLRYLDGMLEGKGIPVILCSDSQYYIKSINEWLEGYIKRNWKNSEGKPTPNKELLQEFNNYLHNPKFKIFTCWVRGHQKGSDDNLWISKNNECDFLCNQAINNILLEYGLPLRK